MVEKSMLKSPFIQVAVCLLASCSLINSGIVIGFPSNIITPLQARGASIQQVSWVGSVCFINAVVASLLAGTLFDLLGRTRILQLVNFIFMMGWLLLAVWPYSMLAIYTGRLLTGIGLGMAGCSAATYTAEVTTPDVRTPLVSMVPVMMSVGIFCANLGAFMHKDSWTEVSYFGFGLSILIIILSPLLPESPLWLISQGRTEEALRQLMTLRGASLPEKVSEEFLRLTSRVQDQQSSTSWFKSFPILMQPEVYKPLVIIILFFAFQQMSGVVIVMQFGVDFTRHAGISSQAYTVAVALAAIRVLSTVVTTWACSLYGRRGPALITGLIMSLSILMLSLHLLNSTWFSAFLILLYVFSGSISYYTLPNSMLGELFPTNVRGLATGITMAMVYLNCFIGGQLYLRMVNMFGFALVFLFFGISGLAGTLFLYLYLPETHGKTLQEIEDNFKTGNVKRKDAEIDEVKS